jgi:hypothetical protein
MDEGKTMAITPLFYPYHLCTYRSEASDSFMTIDDHRDTIHIPTVEISYILPFPAHSCGVAVFL